MSRNSNIRQRATVFATALIATSVVWTFVGCNRTTPFHGVTLLTNATEGSNQRDIFDSSAKYQRQRSAVRLHLPRATGPTRLPLADESPPPGAHVQKEQLSDRQRRSAGWNSSESTFWQRVKGQTNAINFRSPAAYLITRFKLYSTFSIQFEMRTSQADGLVLYSGNVGAGKDFMAVELVSGRLRYVYDVGGGARTVVVGGGGGGGDRATALDDDAWHRVGVVRSTLSEHVITVDDYVTTDHLADGRALFFDAGDELYVGGVPEYAYNTLPTQIRSKDGYLGCLASVQLDRRSVNLLEHPIGIPKTHRKNIVGGCHGPERQHDEGKGNECTEQSCDNSGVCLQQLDGYVCNCEMTSYIGPTCRDDSIGYTFGRLGGAVTFTFPDGDWPDTKRDHVSLGFRTLQSDAVLLRITSGSSNDFIEMELVDGNLVVIYNMGLMQHPIGELFEKFDDGQYHVVRFTRDGSNSTIQVDKLPVQPKHPTGQQLTTFNHQHKVIVGGRQDETGNLFRPFHGTISGLVVNGLRILDLASQRDDRISIDGDVELEVKLTKPSNSPKLFEASEDWTSQQSTYDWHKTLEGKWSLDGKADATDDLIIPTKGLVIGCPPGQSDCPMIVHPVTDSFVRPLTKKSLTPTKWNRSETATSQLLSTLPRLLPDNAAQSSGNSLVPCGDDDDDDEDCDAGSASSSSSAAVDIRVSPPQKESPPFSPYNVAPPTGGSGGGGTRQVARMSRIEQQQQQQSKTSLVDETTPLVPLSTTTAPRSTQRPPVYLATSAAAAAASVATSRLYISNEFGRDDDDDDQEEDDEGESAEFRPFPSDHDVVEDLDPPGVHPHHNRSLFVGRSLSMNIGLIAGIGAGIVVLVVVLAYALFKFRGRGHGPRKMGQLSQLGDFDETGQSILTAKETGSAVGGGGGGGHMHDTGTSGAKRKKKDVKEWYV